jgi:REP element-mobilizing transposase RayT
MGMAVKAAHCYPYEELLPQRQPKEEAVSRFRKLSHTIWHCQYHVVWVPKYRFRILKGRVKEACEASIEAICGYAGCEVVELNVQSDHVHLVAMISPKVSISQLMGASEGADIDEDVPPV